MFSASPFPAGIGQDAGGRRRDRKGGFSSARMKDTGIGMSKDFIPKIFEAFSQEDAGVSNRYGSTGLGMAITKNIVNMMNGDITVESEQGKGSTFTVTVTLKASSRSAQQESGVTLPENLRMLIVDDNETACQQARIAANAVGIHADVATKGEDALDLLIKRLREGKPYHFVMSDYKMPGMDGLALTQAIRAIDKGETAIIILTGYSGEDIENECVKIGVDGILSKPLFADSMLYEIQRITEKRSRAKKRAALEDAPPKGEDKSLNGRRILLAEDMDINAEILIDLLDMEGIAADRAENGQEAVDLFAQHPENYYDAVLMDVRMPVMYGLEAARALRALDRLDAKAVPIIALTANAFDEDVQRSLQAGMNANLSKPVEPERLFEALRRLI